MRDVLLATSPGAFVLTAYFGPGTLVNIVFGGLIAVGASTPLWRCGVATPKSQSAISACS